MTLRDVAPPEVIPSSSAHTTTIDPHKAKIARRRRIEIQKLKSSCRQEAANNGVLYGTPVMTDVREENDVTTSRRTHGVVSVMGRRREMEDAVRVERGFVDVGSAGAAGCKKKKYDFFGVYDGHGGSHVAEACRDRLHAILAEEVVGRCEEDTWRVLDGCDNNNNNNHGVVDWEGAIRKCFERMDNEVGGGRAADEVEEMTVGSTAVAAVVGEEEIVVANCGDSRAVLCRNGVAVPLSCDHKPDRPDELARIEVAGGRVINWNGFRVLGVLATSRSIGDHYLKPYVSSTPEVTINKRTEGDEFLILASDGLWDVISNEVACNVVRRCLTGKIQKKCQQLTNGICNKLNSRSRAEVAAALLTELAIAKGSKDNISIIVAPLRKFGRDSFVHRDKCLSV